MNSPDENPKLPMWIFFLTDVVLLTAAWFIARQSPPPLSPQAMFAVFGLIFGGALIALVPLIARFERQKNAVLDDRQRALEALARTVSASAEQISIAAGGLHEIAELTHKNLRHAEQLPHKLQEKIAEFQAQLANVTDLEKEELEKELVALRSSESERLESISAKIAKAAADWSKLEAATHQHLAAASEAVARLSAVTTASAQAVESARMAALAEIDVKLAQASATIFERHTQESAKKAAASSIHVERSPDPAGAIPEAQELAAALPLEVHAGAPTIETIALPAEVPAAAKRPHKPRRNPADAEAPVGEVPVESVSSIPATNTPEGAMEALEPAPLPPENIAEVAPVAPHSAEPFPVATEAAAAHAEDPAPAPSPDAETPKPPRKRPTKKAEPEAEAEPSLSLGLEEPSPAGDAEGTGSDVIERVLTSDGATRLLVTAYIGIGNRLFIRGDGPGLSWEKGVPLQFISIGKWRWETTDAAGAVNYTLFKNDEVECATLGAQSLDPGHQHEVTAAF